MSSSPTSDRIGILGDAGRVAVGVALGQAFILLSAPLLSRLYAPSTFGVFAVLTSMESILVVGACFRLEHAIPLPRRDSDGLSVAVCGLLALAVVVSVTSLLLLPLGASIAQWTDTPSLDRYLWLVPVVLAADGVFVLGSYWIVRTRSFADLSMGRVAQGATQACSQLGLGVLSATPTGLMGGVGIGRVLGLALLLRRGWRQLRVAVASLSWSSIRAAFVRYQRFPRIAAPAAVVNSAGLNVPGILIASLYGPLRAGLFLLGTRMVALPITVLGQATAQAYHGHAAALVRESVGTLRGQTRGLVVRLALIGVVPAAAFLIAGPWLFGLVFGQDWTEAGEYVRILSVGFLAQFVVNPVAPALAVVERQDVQLGWDLARLVVVVGALLIPGSFGWSIYGALATLSVANGIMYVLLLGLILRAIPRSA